MTSMRRHYVASTSLRRHVVAGNLPPPLGPPPNILNLAPPPPPPPQYSKPSYAYVSSLSRTGRCHQFRTFASLCPPFSPDSLLISCDLEKYFPQQRLEKPFKYSVRFAILVNLINIFCDISLRNKGMKNCLVYILAVETRERYTCFTLFFSRYAIFILTYLCLKSHEKGVG